MLIIPEKKAILLRLKDPARVTTVIPQARRVSHEGVSYIAVPHQVEVVQVLRNLGIEAPSPIYSYYGWPGRFLPYAHQKEIAAFLTMNNRAFNLGDLGVGKTMATLWAFDYLRSRGIVTKMLVVTPLSTLERTWADEVFNHFPHLTAVSLHGSRDKRFKMLAQDAEIYLINHDGIKVRGFTEAMAQRPDINLIIVDEIAQIGRISSTDRFKALNIIVNRQHPRKAWGLTGAPIPNGPMDAWAQCRLLVPERVSPFKNNFQAQVLRKVSNFVWVPRDGALEIVQEVMQPAIRFHRDECVDLPPCVYETRHVELTPEQSKAYKDMLARLHTELSEGSITAVNEAVKAQKLLQICCGVVYNSEKEHAYLDATPRLQAVLDIVEQSRQKVIVFAPFVGSIPIIRDYLEKHGYTTEAVSGAVSKTERDRIFGAFQREDNPKVLVSIAQTMSHGLTLTAADTIVWYAPTTSADTYTQANARISRPGQKHSQMVVHIEGTALERKYFQRLRDKEDLQGTLLDAIRDERDERIPA